MHLRQLVPLDIYTINRIHVEANVTDTLSRHFCRDVEKYPTTHLRNSLAFIKRTISAPGTITFVVETDPSDHPADQRHLGPRVVGFATWTRQGTSAQAAEWRKLNTGWFDGLNRVLHGIEDRYIKAFPSTNCTFASKQFAELLPYLGEDFDRDVFPEAWELELFFVDPKWQRRGLGRKLMQWGFDRANEEQVPVLVKSSPLGGLAYRGMGFKLIGELGLNRVFDTLKNGGVEPGFWVWEPEGYEGVYIDRAREAWARKHSQVEAA